MDKAIERPILFNGAMVRAILSGEKTQTRRVMKRQPESVVVPGVGRMLAIQQPRGPNRWLWPNARDEVLASCPLGQPGDRLWVRETWRPQIIHCHGMDVCDCDDVGVTYAADGEWVAITHTTEIPDAWLMPEAAARGNVPSIHMPRWASRVLLEISDVRVERLQNISEKDANAEGVDPAGPVGYIPASDAMGRARYQFANLWNSTGGDWAANPWVWVIEFKRVDQAVRA